MRDAHWAMTGWTGQGRGVNPKAHKKKPPEPVSVQTVLMNFGVPGIGLGVGLALVLDNMSANDLTNVDTYIRTDLMIANVGIAPSINACRSQAWFPAEMTTPKLTGKDAAGNTVSIPALEKNRPITSSIYRIRC